VTTDPQSRGAAPAPISYSRVREGSTVGTVDQQKRVAELEQLEKPKPRP
jgi:hypothetical protein